MEEDPFEHNAASEMGIGFSDQALLIVSVAGFCFLAVLGFWIVTRAKGLDDLENKDPNDQDLDYEDELLRSNVKDLNRAQRRARAKALMKRQRRAPAAGDDEQHDDGDDNNNNAEDDYHHDDHQPSLSRKERQKAAKAAEKKERQLLDGERQEEQRLAQQAAREEKKKRLELEAERAREEKVRREQEQEDQKQKAFEHWNAFLGTLTVHEWAQELEECSIVSIERLAERFDVHSEQVETRIRELVAANRVTGILDKGQFIRLTHQELLSLASSIKEKGEVSLDVVSNMAHKIVSAKER